MTTLDNGEEPTSSTFFPSSPRSGSAFKPPILEFQTLSREFVDRVEQMMTAPEKPIGVDTTFTKSKTSQDSQARLIQRELRSKKFQAEVKASGLPVPEPRGVTRARSAALTKELIQFITTPSQRSSQAKKPSLKQRKNIHFSLNTTNNAERSR